MTLTVRRSLLLGILLGTFALSGCSSAKKKKEGIELSALEGKKVALVSIEGEATSRKIVEVALINQLVQHGTFVLISKKDVEAARLDPSQDPSDWQGIARRAGADYALKARVVDFDAKTHEGYETEEVEDSQLAEEQGTDGKTQRVYRVKALDAHVAVELKLTRLSDGDLQTGLAEARDRVEESAGKSAIHLPPRLRFLETLSNRAFRDFFDRNL